MRVNYIDAETELTQLRALVDMFAEEMYKKLEKKYREGERGWEKVSEISSLYTSLFSKLDNSEFGIPTPNLIDIGAISALIWNHMEDA